MKRRAFLDIVIDRPRPVGMEKVLVEQIIIVRFRVWSVALPDRGERYRADDGRAKSGDGGTARGGEAGSADRGVQ